MLCVHTLLTNDGQVPHIVGEIIQNKQCIRSVLGKENICSTQTPGVNGHNYWQQNAFGLGNTAVKKKKKNEREWDRETPLERVCEREKGKSSGRKKRKTGDGGGEKMLRNGIFSLFFNDISLYPPTTNGNRLEVVFLCQLARWQPYTVLSFVYNLCHLHCCWTQPKHMCIYTVYTYYTYTYEYKFAQPNRIYSVEKPFNGFDTIYNKTRVMPSLKYNTFWELKRLCTRTSIEMKFNSVLRFKNLYVRSKLHLICITSILYTVQINH